MSRQTPENSHSAGQWKYMITLTIPGQLEQIRLIHAALSGIFGHLGLQERDNHLLGIAVVEVANNSIEHGYSGDTDSPVEVHLKLSGSEVQVDICDYGPAFPPGQLYRIQGSKAPLPDPGDEWELRGHGLQIVREIVDSIAVRSEGGQNCVTLRKSISMEET